MARINGTSGNDLLRGNYGADEIHGLGGDDVLLAYGAPVGGGAYANYQTKLASTGADSLYGGNGNDQLLGAVGDDYLSGGNGADTLWGWAGEDVLRGGPGIDVFRFAPLGGPFPEPDSGFGGGQGGWDEIVDLQKQDIIDLTGYHNLNSTEPAHWLGKDGSFFPSFQTEATWSQITDDLFVLRVYAPSLRGADPSGEPIPVYGASFEIAMHQAPTQAQVWL